MVRKRVTNAEVSGFKSVHWPPLVHISSYMLHHTAADICHFTSHHVIKWTIFQCTEVYQELSSVYYDWWTFKRTGSAVRTSRHYARLWCHYRRIWDIESSASVSLVGLGLLNGTLSEVGPVNIFLSRVSTLTRDFDIAILSVRPSVRDVPGLDENGLTYCHSFLPYGIAKSF